ncbi:predicted protein [Naegleria gruberi]|uniref:Predicted protein n=1 Tax=Naegleria gruberi TaxID=5762 RepID=D2V580_NAEGR|nr:uncharacterized protein NAEGRDRAFT_64045 [Naegleria gruberi]EFC48062.1 predicted protein [Naegleria gruberi]|eukprot:XP_002680806.1 predicted protein [Naegleria gruberi strain NEG-M]
MPARSQPTPSNQYTSPRSASDQEESDQESTQNKQTSQGTPQKKVSKKTLEARSEEELTEREEEDLKEIGLHYCSNILSKKLSNLSQGVRVAKYDDPPISEHSEDELTDEQSKKPTKRFESYTKDENGKFSTEVCFRGSTEEFITEFQRHIRNKSSANCNRRINRRNNIKPINLD